MKNNKQSMKLEALEQKLLMSGDTYQDAAQAWEAAVNISSSISNDFLSSAPLQNDLPLLVEVGDTQDSPVSL